MCIVHIQRVQLSLVCSKYRVTLVRRFVSIHTFCMYTLIFECMIVIHTFIMIAIQLSVDCSIMLFYFLQELKESDELLSTLGISN